ncbi:DMT family transporter [Hyphomicrobium sp. CS1BSMeth3]|uniref:DMT family transporter n=1 Tax=Hyphomicrobium sp. CS1BSMeth3 TaxID=1892844 RepID=UPI0009306358|nr:DMT family transporter [Hyphomicrobium sp. CS1BSMeth3]
MRRIHADLLLILAAVIWGVAFVFQKTAMAHVGPLLFVAARSTVAMLALTPLAIREGREAPDQFPRGLLSIAALAGLAFFLGAALQQVGIVTATATNAGFLTALYVVITPFLVWIVMRRAPAWIVWPAVVMSFVGVWLLGGGTIGSFAHGDLLVAISAFFWAAHVVIVAQATRHARPVTFSAIQFAVVAVLGLTGALLSEPISLTALAAAWREIAYVGLLSSALTFTLLAIAMKYTPPTEAAIIVSSETLFAALAAYMLLGERLSLAGWCGAGLILMAVLLVQTGPTIEQLLQRLRAK